MLWLINLKFERTWTHRVALGKLHEESFLEEPGAIKFRLEYISIDWSMFKI